MEAEDLINIGAYVKGSNPRIDFAISKIDAVNEFLRQNFDESTSLKQTKEELGLLLNERKDIDSPVKNRRAGDQ